VCLLNIYSGQFCKRGPYTMDLEIMLALANECMGLYHCIITYMALMLGTLLVKMTIITV
jgi:hypothetical protein